MRDASFEVLALLAGASAAVIYAFVCDHRAEQAARRAVSRVRERRPAALDALPPVYRRFARATVKLRLLQTAGVTEIISREVIEVERWRRRMLIAIVLGIGSVIFALVGTHVFQWRWA